MKVKSESEVVQSCLTPSYPMDCSLPGPSVHGIFQARVLEWVAIAFSVVFPTFFNFSLNLAIRSSWSEPQSAPSLVFADCIDFSIFGCKEYNQSDFSVDHLVMSMCRVFSCVVGSGCLLWPVHSLGKILLTLSLFKILYSKTKLVCYSRYLLTSCFCIPIPYHEKDIFFWH